MTTSRESYTVGPEEVCGKYQRIEAMRFNGSNGHKLVTWMGPWVTSAGDNTPGQLLISTVDGAMWCMPGDWVLHLDNYFWTVSAEAFEEDYELGPQMSAPDMLAVINRVREMHDPICEHSGANCKSPTCTMLVCRECGTDYPCDTRRALDTP